MATKRAITQLKVLRKQLLTCSRQLSTACRLQQQEGRPEIWDAESLLDIGTGPLYTTEHDILRQSVRRFIKEELVPNYPRYEEQGYVDKEVWKKAGDQGLLGINIPEEQGGHGGDVLSSAIIWEEMWRHNTYAPVFPNHSDGVMRYVSKQGSDDMVKHYMPKFVSGEWVSAIGMTEPDAGSDMQGFKSYARKDGDDFILNGSKAFITNGWVADVVMVAALTDKNVKASRGMSLFLVEEDMPGFVKSRLLKKIGLHCEDTAELFFEDVRLSKHHLIGEVNRGFHYMIQNLPRERLLIAGWAIGGCEFMFETTRQYVKERKAFGARLADLQVIQHKLAEMKTEICIGRTFYEECLRAENEARLTPEGAAMVKYWLTDLQKRVAAECLQLHGGWGYMQEFPISSAYVNSAAQAIYGGANEIMKNIIVKPIIR